MAEVVVGVFVSQTGLPPSCWRGERKGTEFSPTKSRHLPSPLRLRFQGGALSSPEI